MLDHNKKWDVFYDTLEHRNTPPKLHALLYVKMLTMIGPPESARCPSFRENVEALFDSKALIKDIEKMVGDNLLDELSFKVFERQIMKYVSSTYPFSDNCKHDVQNHQGETTVKNEKDQAPQKPQSEQTMENQQQAFNDQHTTQGETMNDKQKQQADIHALLSAAILNKSDQEVRTLFSTFCSSVVSKGMIDQNVAAHLHNLFGTYTKVPKGSTFQPRNPQFQPFAPMPPFMPMGFQQPHFPQPPNMGFQGLHPSQFQNPQAFRPNLPNQGARYEAELTLQQLDSQLAQTMMQLQQLEQAVENTKFHQTSLNAQCAAIRNLLNSTSGK